MSKVSTKGLVQSVLFTSDNAHVNMDDGSKWCVPHVEAEKALAACRAVPRRTIEILADIDVDAQGPWRYHTVRIVPVVVVMVRGTVVFVDRDGIVIVEPESGREEHVRFTVTNHRVAALAMHDEVSIEIFSVDDGPYMVRALDKGGHNGSV